MKTSGHILSKQELKVLAQETAISLLHSLMVYHPVKLVTKEAIEQIGDTNKYYLKETGAPFVTLQSLDLEMPRFNTLQAVKTAMAGLCGDILKHVNDVWSERHYGSPMYLLGGPKVEFTHVGNTLRVRIDIVLAGATTIEQANNREKYLQKKKLLTA